MNQSARKTAGFTIIELLVVISIFVIILTFLVIGFQNFSRFQQYNQAVSDVEFLLKQARVDARSAVADEAHGVKFQSNSITRFIGTTYSAVDPDNEVTTYPQVTITPNLTGGVDEIVFSRLTGLPSATGTILVEGVAFTSSTTITVTDSGVIE